MNVDLSEIQLAVQGRIEAWIWSEPCLNQSHFTRFETYLFDLNLPVGEQLTWFEEKIKWCSLRRRWEAQHCAISNQWQQQHQKPISQQHNLILYQFLWKKEQVVERAKRWWMRVTKCCCSSSSRAEIASWMAARRSFSWYDVVDGCQSIEQQWEPSENREQRGSPAEDIAGWIEPTWRMHPPNRL